MKAAVLQAHGEPLSIEEVEDPSVDPDGAVVEIEACGICRSDWHAWQGHWGWMGLEAHPGQILGHEPAGRVVEIGEEVERIAEGDHVAIPFNLGDGTCSECRRGYSNTCESPTPLGFVPFAQGAFAEYTHVPAAEHNLVRLPEGVSSTEMAGMGCRFVTAFRALAHRAEVNAGDWVAIHGCGGVGLSAVHVADALGANVVAIDVDPDTLERAGDLGAVETINANEVGDVASAVRARTDGGAHVSMDALGIAATCRNSVESLRNRGRHVQVGLTTDEEEGEIALPTDRIVSKEIEFLGSLGMPPIRYDEIFRMVDTGTLRPADVVSETVALEDVSAYLEAMTDYGTSGIPVITKF